MVKYRRSWTAVKGEMIADPEVQAGYDVARRAFELGAQVRGFREAQGMSQAELAQRMGASQSAIARLEAGGVDPKLETLGRVSRVLGVDLVVEFRLCAGGKVGA
jgi:ribosome-binding protein aMBF1 (putative translation factor)